MCRACRRLRHVRTAGGIQKVGNAHPTRDLTRYWAPTASAQRSRKELRRFFEVDAENIAMAALVELPRTEIPARKAVQCSEDAWTGRGQVEPVSI